jgi:hypothetical protein
MQFVAWRSSYIQHFRLANFISLRDHYNDAHGGAIYAFLEPQRLLLPVEAENLDNADVDFRLFFDPHAVWASHVCVFDGLNRVPCERGLASALLQRTDNALRMTCRHFASPCCRRCGDNRKRRQRWVAGLALQHGFQLLLQ